MILLILGTGLGLSSVSPWALDGVSATTFGVSTIVWLTLTQLLASGMGGYLAGRLRTNKGIPMKYSILFPALLAALALSACDRPTVVTPAPVVTVPVAGPAG